MPCFLSAGSSRPSFFPLGARSVPLEEVSGPTVSNMPQAQHRHQTLSRSLISQLALAPAGPPTQSVLSPCLSASQGCASCASQIAPVIHIDISCAGQGQGSRTSVRRLWSPAVRLCPVRTVLGSPGDSVRWGVLLTYPLTHHTLLL